MAKRVIVTTVSWTDSSLAFWLRCNQNVFGALHEYLAEQLVHNWNDADRPIIVRDVRAAFLEENLYQR